MSRARSCGIFVCGILLAVAGNAWAAPQTVSAEPGTGLAFGAFDITQSDLAVTHAVLMRVKPARMYMGSSGEKGTITYTNGEFFSPNLAPGMYSVVGLFSGDKFFALERGLREHTFTVEPGRVTYAGSYKLSSRRAACSETTKARSPASTRLRPIGSPSSGLRRNSAQAAGLRR